MVVKFAILAALIIAALYVLHFFRVIGERGSTRTPKRSRGRRLPVEETRRCTACGTYVTAAAAACGRPDCPFPLRPRA